MNILLLNVPFPAAQLQAVVVWGHFSSDAREPVEDDNRNTNHSLHLWGTHHVPGTRNFSWIVLHTFQRNHELSTIVISVDTRVGTEFQRGAVT